MKPINFYRKGTPHHHKAVTRWAQLNVIGLLLVTVTCSTLQLRQSRTMHSLASDKTMVQKQCKQLECMLKDLQTQDILTFASKKSIPKSTASPQKNYQTILKEFKNALTDHAVVEKIVMKGQEIEMKISWKHVTQVEKFTESLCSNKNLETLNLVTIEQNPKNEFIATFVYMNPTIRTYYS